MTSLSSLSSLSISASSCPPVTRKTRLNLTPAQCRCCDTPIGINVPVLPHKWPGTNKQQWGHPLCVEILESKEEVNDDAKEGDGNAMAEKFIDTPVCRHWKRSGRCDFGIKCYFSHPEDQKGKPPPPLQTNNVTAAPKEPRKRRPGGRPHLRNKSRSFVLRKFVIDNFPGSCLEGT